MGLKVALDHDPQAEFVAQVEERGMRRVVRGAHGVNVVPLHQLHVAAHDFEGYGTAVIGIELVPVHAAQHHPATVDPEHPGLVDGHAAEPDPHPDPLAAGGHVGLVRSTAGVPAQVAGRSKVRR